MGECCDASYTMPLIRLIGKKAVIKKSQKKALKLIFSFGILLFQCLKQCVLQFHLYFRKQRTAEREKNHSQDCSCQICIVIVCLACVAGGHKRRRKNSISGGQGDKLGFCRHVEQFLLNSFDMAPETEFANSARNRIF